MSLIIDGIPVKDLKTSGAFTEFDTSDRAETEIKESTELKDAMEELNKDELDSDTKMSSIDMRSNLHYTEISGLLACDALVMFRVLPQRCLNYTRQKKRLAPSLNGMGRNQQVAIVAGKRDVEAKTQGMSLGDRLRGLVGSGKKDETQQ